MVTESQSDLAPQQTVSDPVEIRSARGRPLAVSSGEKANLSWERDAVGRPQHVALVALLGGGIWNRGESAAQLRPKPSSTQYLEPWFSAPIPSMEPTTDNALPRPFSDPGRRRRMEDIEALRIRGRPCDLQRQRCVLSARVLNVPIGLHRRGGGCAGVPPRTCPGIDGGRRIQRERSARSATLTWISTRCWEWRCCRHPTC